jgi:hypothetical protein
VQIICQDEISAWKAQDRVANKIAAAPSIGARDYEEE